MSFSATAWPSPAWPGTRCGSSARCSAGGRSRTRSPAPRRAAPAARPSTTRMGRPWRGPGNPARVPRCTGGPGNPARVPPSTGGPAWSREEKGDGERGGDPRGHEAGGGSRAGGQRGRPRPGLRRRAGGRGPQGPPRHDPDHRGLPADRHDRGRHRRGPGRPGRHRAGRDQLGVVAPVGPRAADRGRQDGASGHGVCDLRKGPMVLPALVEPAAEELSRDEIFRYSRHLIIPDVAMDGQKRLRNARVLLIGAGGLGSPNAMYLAAAGVGHLGLVDFDEVDASNLQRQVIHGTSDIGRPKLESARDKIQEINPYVEVTLHETRLSSENAREIIRGYDLIVDGSDNFPTRYLVNDACVLEHKPYVWGSIYRFDGQASVFWAEHGPCYRCLYPEPPPPGMVPSCAEGGVLGVLCATVGSVQANEAIKLITGIGDPLVGRLLIYDALELSFKDIAVRKDPDCAVCGEHPTITELIVYEEFCGG